MFPEGTRRTKGLAQEVRGAPAQRARRGSRSRPACRSCRPRSRAPTGCAGSAAARRLRGAGRDRRPARPAPREAAQEATERLMARDRRARGVLVSGVAARGRRRLARAPRLPRAPEDDPRLQRASSASRTCSSRLWEASTRTRWSSAGTRSRCRRTGTRRSGLPVGARVRRLARRQLASCPASSALGFAVGKARRLRGRRLPRRAAQRPGRATCSSSPPTETRSSS